MKFAHMADVHIGSWRDPRLKELSVEAFTKAIDICVHEKVDFILIAGDLFNTALPGIDSLKSVVKELKRLQHKINVYMIPGSHDFSPSGKTMVDVLEEAGLVKNVVKGTVVNEKLVLKFTTDEKTHMKITGILGKRGTLERHYYENLDLKSLEDEPGKKIFMFHSAIKELMPNGFQAMESMELSLLPKHFEYYAGGHVHIVKEYVDEDHDEIVYPGPLFPANFSELENLEKGGFFIYNNGELERHDINIKNIFKIIIDANHKSPEETEAMMEEKIKGKQFINTIVLLKISGILRTGKPSDINMKNIMEKIYSLGAFFVMKSTSKLNSEEFEEVKIDTNIADVEDSLIREHLGQVKVSGFNADKEYETIKELIQVLSQEKHEGEKVYEYEERVRKEADKTLGL